MEYSDKYMTKKETTPWKKDFNERIRKVISAMKMRGISFSYCLVGSSKRNLVIRHHNKGFDLDYQLRIQKMPNDLAPKKLKQDLMDAVNEAWERSSFSSCEDSTSSITIKCVDNENSKIVSGCDIVILKTADDGLESILHFRKKDRVYVFETLPESKLDKQKVVFVKDNALWDEVRKEYYRLKITNKTEKKSFQLYIETINNVSEQNGFRRN